jgi:hypothetical protein
VTWPQRGRVGSKAQSGGTGQQGGGLGDRLARGGASLQAGQGGIVEAVPDIYPPPTFEIIEGGLGARDRWPA